MSVQEDAIETPSRGRVSERPSAPTPWTSIALSAVVVALASVLCTILFSRFLDSRILDLRPTSNDLKSYVVGLLLERGIP
ncbi:MAG: hypothetical protein WC655_12250, partial [Candidatus Hydrogenedentales bacterium]